LTSEPSAQCLPEWLRDCYSELHTRLSPRASKELDAFAKQYLLITEWFAKLPEQSVLYELYQIKPEKLRALFPDAYSALAHACEAVIGRWFFQHVYKFKASFDGFRYALNEGNFLLSFSCLRGMFEEMAHFHFFLVRIEAGHEKVISLWEQGEPRFAKGKPPTEDWTRNYITVLLEIVQRALKAIQGSDYDWKGWFRQALERAGVTEVDISSQIASHTEMRKTHINDCLAELEKKYQLHANDVYGLLSEMVHPNFGSNTLVIVTRNRINDLVGEAVLSSNPKNVEAAAWFFELIAEELCRIFELERAYLNRSQELFNFYQAAAMARPDKIQ
jgi:hypothetical protein